MQLSEFPQIVHHSLLYIIYMYAGQFMYLLNLKKKKKSLIDLQIVQTVQKNV